MPAHAATPSRLLVFAPPDEARHPIAVLREGGLDVHGTDSLEPDALAALLARDPCDLILACAYVPAVDLDAVLAEYQRLAGDVPLIVLADSSSDPRSLTWAMERGARDTVDHNDGLRLRLVVQRELGDLAARRELRSLSERLRHGQAAPGPLGDSDAEAIALIQDGMHADANPAYLQLFGFPSADDMHTAALLDLILPEGQTAVRDLLRECRSGPTREGAALRVTCVRADGSRFPAALSATPAEIDGEPGVRLCVRRLDLPPTAPPGGQASAPGYPELMTAISAAVGPEHRADSPFALFYAAIHTSPALFGALGLSRGLHIIAELGAALVRFCSHLAVPVQLNVDGYGFLVPGLDAAGAADLAEQIRTQVRLPPDTDGGDAIEVRWDLGLVAVPAGPCAAPSALLDAAYRACHGSTAVPVKPVYPQEPTSLAARTSQVRVGNDGEQLTIGRLQEAMDQGRLRLVYQPIISLMGESQENYSVLLRLLDPAGELVEAQSFIGAAIRAGLIQALDRWVIRNAAATLAEHRRRGHAVNLFINLAEDSVRDRDLQFWVRDCLREFGVHASWFTLVIQEQLLSVDPGGVGPGGLGPVVERLKTLGCRIAVNYFGATDHSEQLLGSLSPDLVLLLPDYAKGLSADPNKQQRLATLAAAAREAGIKTVVTGVEDAPSLTILWTASVDYVQGNFLQRPSPNLESAA